MRSSERLLGVLPQFGFEMDRADVTVRGVTAHKGFFWSWLAGVATARVAAAVDPAGEGGSLVVIESAPAYMPLVMAVGSHRRNVRRMLDLLQRSIER